jgi:hypothetical protein
MKNTDSKNLIAVEALYQMLRAGCLQRRILLGRGEFLAGFFQVTVTIDGMLALALAGHSFDIEGMDTPQSNGRAPIPRRR